ncbi:site-specific DNA-methyltransferase [Agromyces mangrovi Wang et al. 2018]|uniref:site-specific DNA-methyltransferase n=1 Tax=Agromyces mangrovi TaxID=1858653 RepID=UPI0025727CAC|nr:site-specific DNA-methyltransferase [Agromyces mangrovi]
MTFYDESKEALPPLRYPRNAELDPQLVWRGKDAQDGEHLVVDAPPIYIQEKIAPQALVENLRNQSKVTPSDEVPSLFDFDYFDELDELSAVEFYQHEESWKNRMILGDSLQVMGSLAEREALRGKVQMIYIDPPYGIKFGSNWQARASRRDVKDGKLDDAAREAEQIKAFRDTWELGIHSYLTYLRDRLVVARDLLTDSGSVFVQIGDENVHLVRSLMDEIFGMENFMTQIAFATTSGAGSFAGGTDVLANVLNFVVAYSKDLGSAKYRQLYRTKSVGGDASSLYTSVELPDGSTRPLTRDERAGATLPEGARAYGVDNLTSQTTRVGQTTVFPVTVNGKTVTPQKGGWKTNRVGMQRLVDAGRVYAGSGANLGYIRYVDDFPAAPISNLWTDTLGQGQFGGDKVYVVQTANRVIERCMLMATDPGDLVLDPTCGSGTTAFVAEQWGRRWITIDTSRVALALARQRLVGAKFPYYVKADTDEGRKIQGLPPALTGGDLRHGFVYKKVQHITLKSIANNPDIREGMTREEIDAAIKLHADFELLYDKPEEDKSRVRVSGPFTVESLSPHRSVSFSEADDLRPGSTDADTPSFEQSILTNLRAAGIQNGRKTERLVFESIESHPGAYMQAIGTQKESAEQLAIALGPQYGTVSASFIKNAAREAVDADIPIVAVLGFAFDPQLGVETDDEGFAVVAGVRDLGRVKVLVVRMNVDLLMGEELKKTGSGNLFTVFGEPDLGLRSVDSQWEVEVRGIDVYDPTSGEVRSNSTKEIALWMIDTNYDGESFFVRHAYFLGDNDPYKALKTALKTEIHPEAWAALYRPVSVPFDTPSTGKIAVKVINDYGDEVMKVLEVG